jgi:hypothetical protein
MCSKPGVSEKKTLHNEVMCPLLGFFFTQLVLYLKLQWQCTNTELLRLSDRQSVASSNDVTMIRNGSKDQPPTRIREF